MFAGVGAIKRLERAYEYKRNEANKIFLAEKKVIYDNNILVQYFIEEISKKDNFNYIIDSMYSLRNDFKSKVVQDSEDNVLSHILNLFTWVRTTVRQNKKISNTEDCNQEIKYFLEEKIDLTLSCPQIYISVVDFILKRNKYELILPLL